ncbi:hypothetical protein F4V44_13220 [Niallia endozanthoxylica]|uniref:Uncharacterized protein n=2 Tax=Niallia endozanthoxylica TaxID=2036016 RepID=A0A5J5HPF2_9BACI|nr:hypothetical protein F4V44_13220 [Niallia endozanthoxylica]
MIEDVFTVGYNVILHAYIVKKRTMIGRGSSISDGAQIGEECIIGANTLIPSGKKIPPRPLVPGLPGKVVCELNEKDLELIHLSIASYVQKGNQFKNTLTEG